jgi:hypothetical protein
LAQALLERRPWLRDLFDLAPGPRLHQRWEPRGVASLRGQWRALRRRLGAARVLIQVGKCWELHGGDHEGLPPRLLRRAQPMARAGMGAGWSVPRSVGAQIEAHWRGAGQAHAVVAEEGRLRGGLKRRLLRRVYRPAG